MKSAKTDRVQCDWCTACGIGDDGVRTQVGHKQNGCLAGNNPPHYPVRMRSVLPALPGGCAATN